LFTVVHSQALVYLSSSSSQAPLLPHQRHFISKVVATIKPLFPSAA